MGKRDGNEKLIRFAKDLEACCVEAVDVDGVMTKVRLRFRVAL
jgi:isocitrate dehydrogenase